MGKRTFKLEIGIAVAISEVRAFLLDLENLAPLHPLIESIEDLDPRPERPAARRYRVVDKIPVGPFRMRTVYTAELEQLREDEIYGRAWQSPGIRLVTRYRLSPLTGLNLDKGTHLDEHVEVEAPFGLRGFVVRQASRAHSETLVKMKQLLEARTSIVL